MVNVMVVGSNAAACLARLRGIASLGEQRLRPCGDLARCDLLVIADTPGLRRAADCIQKQRPGLICWINGPGGRLLAGEGMQACELDDGEIRRALQDLQPAGRRPTRPPLARGAPAIGELLRQHVPQREGTWMLTDGHGPLVWLDLPAEHAVSLAGPIAVLVERLVRRADVLQAHPGTPSEWPVLAGAHPRQALRPFLWQWGHGSPQWGTLDHRLRREAVRLRRWPDFRVLGRDADRFRLCSLLLRRACTVDACTMLLDLPAQTVRQFVYAAYLCGDANLVQEPASLVRRGGEQPADAGLVARMWRTLRRRA